MLWVSSAVGVAESSGCDATASSTRVGVSWALELVCVSSDSEPELSSSMYSSSSKGISMELDSSSAAAASLSEALVSLDAVESSAGSSGPASTTASLATAAASSVTSVRTVAASPDTVAVFCISNCSPTVEIDSDSRDPTSIDLTSSASSVNSGRRTGSTSGIAGVSLVIGASGKAVSSIFDLSATVTSALPLLRSSSTVVSVCNWISASANASGEDLDSVAWVVVSSLTSTSVIFWSNSETSPLSTSSSIPASRGVASVVAEGSVVGGAGTSFSSGCTED